jgi:RNA recognition motif-containing protein
MEGTPTVLWARASLGLPFSHLQLTHLAHVHKNMAQPNATLYVNNLNDKVNKDELKAQLFALFTTYGKVIDVVASKTPKMRGQAFLVFSELAGATSAMRACEGMVFYDKPLVRVFEQRFKYE